MKNINEEQLIRFHQKIIESSGGKSGIRNYKLIDSALNRGISTFGGEDLYSTDIEKIAAITHSLITNHCFMDGNKRIGVAAMLLLLNLNDVKVDYSQKELIELGLGVASSNLKYEDIVNWIKDHCIN